MSRIKPPSFPQLPAQCLGNLLPNSLATKAKKTLQNTDDQKQKRRNASLPCICSLAAWQRYGLLEGGFLQVLPCQLSPQNSDGTPPRSSCRLEGSVKKTQNPGKVHTSPSAWQSPPSSGCPRGSVTADLVRHHFWGEKRSNPPILRRRLSERALFFFFFSPPVRACRCFIP